MYAGGGVPLSNEYQRERETLTDRREVEERRANANKYRKETARARLGPRALGNHKSITRGCVPTRPINAALLNYRYCDTCMEI